MDAKVSTKTKTKMFQNLNKNCPKVLFFKSKDSIAASMVRVCVRNLDLLVQPVL